VDIQIRLASAIRFREGFVKAHQRAGAALELAERLDDDSLQVRALAVLADLGAAIGDEDAQAQAAKALGLAGESGEPRLEHLVAYVRAIGIRDEPRRQFLEDEYERWRERDEPRSADALWELSLIELELGSWELAAEHAARARDISFQYGIEIPQHHLPIAWIAVHRGQLDLARETSTRALELAEQQFGLHPPYHLSVIGLVALWGETLRPAPSGSGVRTRARWSSGGSTPPIGPGPTTTSRPCSSSVGSTRRWKYSTHGKPARGALDDRGSSFTSCGVGAKSQPPAERSTRRCCSWTTRLLVTRRSAIPTAGRVHSSPSASFAGAHGRSVLHGMRFSKRSLDSSRSARRPGSSDASRSSEASAAARVRKA
jgi:hypothetical protein